MKAYYYTPEECGKSAPPDGGLKLGGFEPTTDPVAADVFVCPYMLHHMGDSKERGMVSIDRILALPYLRGNERRHAFFNVADTFRFTLPFDGIFLRCDATKATLRDNPTTIPIAWPVRDHGECMPVPPGGFGYDVCFIGWQSTPMNAEACAYLAASNHNTYLVQRRQFFGYAARDFGQEEADRQQREYRDVLARSRFSLCVRSIPEGVLRYRFFEAMSAGRIPILIGDGSALPLADRIDYKRCIVQIPECEVKNIGAYVTKLREGMTDEQIIAAGRYGREAWEKWLNADNWTDLHGMLVREALEKL